MVVTTTVSAMVMVVRVGTSVVVEVDGRTAPAAVGVEEGELWLPLTPKRCTFRLPEQNAFTKLLPAINLRKKKESFPSQKKDSSHNSVQRSQHFSNNQNHLCFGEKGDTAAHVY